MSLGRLLRRASDLDAASGTDADDSWLNTVARVRHDLRAGLVPEQLAPFEDDNRWDAVCCSRQSGKTYVAARLLVDVSLAAPDRISVYVSDTFRHAREAMWDDQTDGLPAVLGSLGLSEDSGDFRINLSQLRVTFRNGSFVELQGADRGAWAGFRGRKIDLIVADEMQRQEQEHLRQALRKDVPDCLMARRGRFVGLGTVGRALRGVWYELNRETPPGWRSFHWTARELRHLTPVWDEQVAWAGAMGIDTTADPDWLREKAGVWVRDERGLVHHLTDRSLWDGRLPATVRTRCPEHGHLNIRCVCEVPLVPRVGELEHYGGFDFGGGDGPGSGDPCAVVIGSVSREEGVLREVHSEEFYAADSDSVGSRLRGLRDRFGVRNFYLDPAWKLSVKDMARTYGLPVDNALKGDAEGTDEDFWHSERRSALNQGTMQVLQGSVLHGQLESLLRDPVELERGHVRPVPGQPDHAFDAWRYLFRMVRTRHVRLPEPPLSREQSALHDAARMRAQALAPPTRSRDGRDRRDRLGIHR
jgi:hypothetical protein